MRSQQKFFLCKHCGNLVGLLNNAGVPLICCGEPMVELVPNTTDAAQEKHVPVVTAKGREISVNVGSAAHPMTQEHHIAWIYLQTNQPVHPFENNPDHQDQHCNNPHIYCLDTALPQSSNRHIAVPAHVGMGELRMDFSQ